MELGTSFNSKLLLFGEYGLMFDAMALSVPFAHFSGFLDFDPDQSHLESTAEIIKFYDNLKSGETFQYLHFQFNLGMLQTDLENGLFFNSTIPQQYGVGSSGALVAALFRKYAVLTVPENEISPEILKSDFALLESYFHGRSSGLDPLISFLNQPIWVGPKKKIFPIQFDLAKTGLAVGLIDTHQTSATGPLVQYFIDRFNIPKFERAFEKEFIPANNGCIEALLQNQMKSFFPSLEQLVEFQLVHFRKMIPGDFHRLIKNSLADKVYLKLLGSGGGGFLLAFADSENLLKNWAEKEKLQLLQVIKD